MAVWFVPFLVAASPALQSDLSSRIDSLLSHPGLRGAGVSVFVKSLDEGRIVYARDEDVSRIPASNAKLATMAAALCLLGEDFAFETVFAWRGERSGGTLAGDLVVIGGGDPNISGRFFDGNSTALFEEVSARLLELGITKVSGGVILDDHVFDRVYVHPSWPRDQLHEWYCAPVSGLAFNDNCLDVAVEPDREPGLPARVEIHPRTAFLEIRNECVTTAEEASHLVTLYRAPGSRTVVVGGRCWTRGSLPWTSVTVPDPCLFFGTVFLETLARSGIDVERGIELVAHPVPRDGLEIFHRQRFPLSRSLAVLGKRSQNFYAEQILKTIGHADDGREGSFESGCRAITRFLRQEVGLKGAFHVSDGSGLSRDNRYTAAQLVQVLEHMARRPEGETFVSALAISGTDGTLSRRLDGPFRSQVRAKTGYLAQVSALSGYLRTNEGETLAFSILFNGFSGGATAMKAVQDEICMALIRGPEE